MTGDGEEDVEFGLGFGEGLGVGLEKGSGGEEEVGWWETGNKKVEERGSQRPERERKRNEARERPSSRRERRKQNKESETHRAFNPVRTHRL